MIVKRIELQGFKSFQKRTKIIFHPGITTIIGPNGTGKSNIVDALLWVLGGKRLKGLRGERSGDIIFNGNTKLPPMSMADVTLSLNEQEEEVLINHRSFRSGESEYRMNGKSTRLRDVQEFLWKKGVGETEYFVIEQGNIGLFLSSKPVEKRFLLEEAAGTAYYKDKKRQAQNKLENSEQNLIRLEDILIEVSKAKNSLRRQAHASVRYRKSREHIQKLTLVLFNKKIRQIQESMEKIAVDYKKSLNQENKAIKELRKKETELSKIRKDTFDFEKFIKKQQENLFALRTQLTDSKAEKEKETKLTDFLKEKKNSSIKNVEELEQEIAYAVKKENKAKNNLQVLQETLKQKQMLLKKHEQQTRKSREKLENHQKMMDALKKDYLQALSECTEMKNEYAKTEKEIEMTSIQKQKLQSRLQEEISSCRLIEKKIEQSQQRSTKMKKLFENNKKEYSELKECLDQLVSSIQCLKEKIEKLEEKKEKELNELYVLERLEEKQRKTNDTGETPGSIGILADFIKSTKDYAPLIDVLWKEESSAKLIPVLDFVRYLSKENIKGNFILLCPQEENTSLPDVYQDSRVLGHIKSRVIADKRIKKYLSQLIDAAIVNNLKTAVELWNLYPTINYITLDGNLLLSSGLIKPGKEKEGIFTLNLEIESQKKTISLIKKKINPLYSQIKEKNKEKQNLEEKINKNSAHSTQLEKEIEKIEKDMEFYRLEKEKISANISIMEKEILALVNEKKSLMHEENSLLSKVKTLEEKKLSFKNKSEKKAKDIALFQEKNEIVKKNIFEHKSSIEIVKEKMKNTGHEIQSLAQRRENLEAKTVSIDKIIQDCKEKEQTFQKSINRLSKKIISLKKESSNREKSFIQKEDFFNKFHREQQETEKIVKKFREKYESKKEIRMKWEIKKAEVERDMLNLEENCWQELRKTTDEVKKQAEVINIPEKDLEEALAEAKEKFQKFKSVNLLAEQEYNVQKRRYDFLTDQKDDLRKSIDSTKKAITKIDQESKNQFLKALEEVNRNFQEVFSLLFQGGHTELKLTNNEQPLESGIEIIAQPPGKKLQHLSLMSGGEKSLTSLAFFFALFRYKPAPFCILDEVDAALDETNLTRFLSLMKKIKNKTQFILITHNFKSMEVADYIYGTTMKEPNVTSLYSIKLEKKEKR